MSTTMVNLRLLPVLAALVVTGLAPESRGQPDGAAAPHYSFQVGGIGLQVHEQRGDAPSEIVATLALSGHVYDLLHAGSFVYLARGREGMTVVDVSDPLHPRSIRTIAAGVPISHLSEQGQRILMRVETGGLLIYDLAR